MRASGFTLAEAMVAVGIIIVLVSILLPSLGRVREQARITTCAANERRIFEAVVAYANENDRYLPCPLFYSPGRNSVDVQQTIVAGAKSTNGGDHVAWAFRDAGGPVIGMADFRIGSLVTYLGPDETSRQRIAWCPSETVDPRFRNFSYSFNSAIRPASYAGGGVDPYYTLRISDIHSPTQKILLYEERGFYGGGTSVSPDDGEFTLTSVPGPTPSSGTWTPPAWISGRHGAPGEEKAGRDVYQDQQWRSKARSNQLFFDGHVELIDVEEFLKTRAGPTYRPLK